MKVGTEKEKKKGNKLMQIKKNIIHEWMNKGMHENKKTENKWEKARK